MTREQFEDGVQYAEGNWKNENAPHLHVDKKLIRSRFNLDGKQVLDFGCGMGGMTFWYATNWNCEVTGLDIDGHHIEIAKHLQGKHGIKNVHFEKRNIVEQPLEGQFDLIFMNDVAEHIPLPVLKEILTQLKKALKPGGSLFITYPPWKSPYAAHVNHVIKIPWVQFFPKGYVMRLIEKHNHPLVGDLESDLISAYHGLNRLTHSKLTKLTSAAGFQQTYRKSHSFINKWAALKSVNLRFFPLDFLVTKEFLELKAKPQIN
ncbi:MAG TPA: class I SAM-dependent methyltransferase [Saprospiraceae bacterium]|nr:class I SAM-dependent methyltransferase [Saprospiraceae bacterium]